MQTTTNYAMKKIDLTDSPPDITVLNGNFDTIDSEMKKHSDDIGNKASLATTEKGSLVGAVNEVNAQLAQLGDIGFDTLISKILSNSNSNLPDVTISTNTTLTSNFSIYNNLTIDAGVTLKCPQGMSMIIVKGTLTLNNGARIDASECGAAAVVMNADYATSGSGGGILYIIANNIVTSGTPYISSNGGNAIDSISPSYGYTVKPGNGGSFGGFGLTAGSGSGSTFGPAGKAGNAIKMATILKAIMYINPTDIGGASGGTGSSDVSSPYFVSGSGGGAGCYGDGGRGGYYDGTTGKGCGGAGGGGGGAIILASINNIPYVVLQANGGAGGDANGYGGGGGGGGGGLVLVAAPSFAGGISTAGGNAGTGSALYPSEAGYAGMAVSLTI